jgi:hypothetical protein
VGHVFGPKGLDHVASGLIRDRGARISAEAGYGALSAKKTRPAVAAADRSSTGTRHAGSRRFAGRPWVLVSSGTRQDAVEAEARPASAAGSSGTRRGRVEAPAGRPLRARCRLARDAARIQAVAKPASAASSRLARDTTPARRPRASRRGRAVVSRATRRHRSGRGRPSGPGVVWHATAGPNPQRPDTSITNSISSCISMPCCPTDGIVGLSVARASSTAPRRTSLRRKPRRW